MNAYKQISEWKEIEVNETMEYVLRIHNRLIELKAQRKSSEFWTLVEVKNISQKMMELQRYIVSNNEMVKSAVVKLVDEHFEALQNKVIDKIGNIEQIETIGNNGADYKFIGENGNLQIKVVVAGGWNIQCRHTRWTISKIK